MAVQTTPNTVQKPYAKTFQTSFATETTCEVVKRKMSNIREMALVQGNYLL